MYLDGYRTVQKSYEKQPNNYIGSGLELILQCFSQPLRPNFLTSFMGVGHEKETDRIEWSSHARNCDFRTSGQKLSPDDMYRKARQLFKPDAEWVERHFDTRQVTALILMKQLQQIGSQDY